MRLGSGAASATLVAMLLACSRLAAAQDTMTTPYPGVRRLRRVTANQHINALFVDLCAPGVSVRVTGMAERARTVPSYGALVGAQAAVNGGFYNTANLAATDGYVLHDGVAWGGTDHDYTGPVAFGANRVELLPHEMVAPPAAWMREAVEGHPTLVHDGVARDNRGDTSLCPRNPRTAVGLTTDRRTLILAVVDGRAASRVGMTCNELAALMQGFGARWALNLDGGGSSTMWLASAGVLNFPSDGSPRTVSNHLAVYARGSGAAPHCPPPRFRAVYVSQTFPLARTTLDLAPGATFTGYIELRNEGTLAWTPALTRLATTQPRDRASMVAGADWVAPNRPAAVDRMVPPGMTGRFAFTVRAPETPGEYSEYFGVVQEGVAWFSDPGEGGPPDNQLQIRVRSVPGAMSDAGGDDASATDGGDPADGRGGEDAMPSEAGASADGGPAGNADAGDGRAGDGGAGAGAVGCACSAAVGAGASRGVGGARGLIALALGAVTAAVYRRRRGAV